MMDLTEREEQEMIARAKAGDAKANYDMSLWALEQAAAEPEEERWNRLAAKCLVKAAEAGYAPAQERMNQLLRELRDDRREPAEHQGDDSFDWAGEPENKAAPRPRQEPETPDAKVRAAAVGGMAAKTVGSAAKSLARKTKSLFGQKNQPEDGGKSEPPAEASGGGHAASGRRFFNFSQWDDAKWKRMQIVCIIICVVLAILLAVMFISGRKDKTQEDESQIPIAATAEPVAPTPTEVPVLYPDESVRAEIEAASLDIYPDDTDYVDEETTAAVSAGAGLNLRRGPGSSYSQIVLMEYNAELEVYAYKNGWALVKYNGAAWGWCSDDYLKQ